MLVHYYNIPRKIRELQLNLLPKVIKTIITYQEKLGNYNNDSDLWLLALIITYQEKLGNYNSNVGMKEMYPIITYQEKLGNYNLSCGIRK